MDLDLINLTTEKLIHHHEYVYKSRSGGVHMVKRKSWITSMLLMLVTALVLAGCGGEAEAQVQEAGIKS